MATNSELVDKGIWVDGMIFAPSEPDMKGVKMVRGEFVANQPLPDRARCSALCSETSSSTFSGLIRRVRPSVLLRPGVQESLGFVEQFNAMGVKVGGLTERRQSRNASASSLQ